MIATRSAAPSCYHQAYLKGSQGSKATKPSMQQGRKAKGDSCFSRLMYSVQKVFNEAVQVNRATCGVALTDCFTVVRARFCSISKTVQFP